MPVSAEIRACQALLVFCSVFRTIHNALEIPLQIVPRANSSGIFRETKAFQASLHPASCSLGFALQWYLALLAVDPAVIALWHGKLKATGYNFGHIAP